MAVIVAVCALLVVGFAAGGPSDIVARAFGDHAAKPLGQPVIVENKPGANAILATEAVAGSKPDGLTLLAAATNHTMIPALYGGRIRFDAARSFVPVCTLASSATVLVVGPSMPVKSVSEFVERAKAKPDAITYATPGQGSSPHLATEQFRKGDRSELAAKEEREAAILESYLPRQASEEEIRSAIAEIVAAQGLSGPAAIGVVMKATLARFEHGQDDAFDHAAGWLYEGMANAYRNGAARLAICAAEGADPDRDAPDTTGPAPSPDHRGHWWNRLFHPRAT